jgi:hypothetical protein
VVFPASGWEMIPKVLLFAISSCILILKCKILTVKIRILKVLWFLNRSLFRETLL